MKYLLYYTTIVMIVTTFYFGTQLQMAMTLPIISVETERLTYAAFIIGTWLTDLLMVRSSPSPTDSASRKKTYYQVYRCYVIWKYNRAILAVTLLIYLGSIGSSLAFLWFSNSPVAQQENAGLRDAFGIPYGSLSIVLTIMVTCLISGRLLYHRKQDHLAWGSRMGQQYVSIVEIMIESAMLYTAFAIAGLASFAMDSLLQVIFLPIMGIMQVASLFRP